MSKILLIASAFLLLCSAGLSFINKGRLSSSSADLAAAHATATNAQADATKAKAALTKTQNDAKAAMQKAADAQAQVSGFQTQIKDLQTKADSATKDVQAKDTELAALKKQVNDAMGHSNADPNATADLAKQMADLTRQRDELQVVKEGLDGRVKSLEAQVTQAARVESERLSKVALVGLQGRVLAVDRNWNFVVLSLGDRNGVSNNTTMVVQRGGSLVGKVKITSVEPSQSIADIVPNSVPAGVSVQAGDTVVFPGAGG